MHKYSCGRSVRATDLKRPFTKGSQQSALDFIWCESSMKQITHTVQIHDDLQQKELYNKFRKKFLHYTTVSCVTLVDSAALLRIWWVVLTCSGSNFQKWTSDAGFEIITQSNGKNISIRCWFWSLTVFGRPDPSTEKTKQVRLETHLLFTLH